MRLLFASTLVTASLALPVLAKIKTQVGQDADFSQYKTYEWLAPRVLTKTGIVENDDVVAPVIKAAVDKHLAMVGLTKVTAAGDLQIATWALTESVPQLEGFIYSDAVSFEIGSPMASFGRYNHRGTLVVNLIDAMKKKSAWSGIATGTFDKPQQLESKVDKAVADLFKKYPAKR